MSSNQITIKDYLYEGSARFQKIRNDARYKCEKAGKLTKCSKCPYDKHVEVAHIKPIKDFPLDTPISVVNAWDNLIILCPNCHWEHDHGQDVNRKICPSCGKRKIKTSKVCRQCAEKFGIYNQKSKRPSKEKLIELLKDFPMTKIGDKFNVSGNSVKKWCIYYGIVLGNRVGYWAKKRSKSGEPARTRTENERFKRALLYH